MKKVIATPSVTKEILERHSLFAKKSYGQNFLVDSGVVEKIARHAVISDHCVVFEIGPGIGALTQWLCAYAKQVVSFEIDERMRSVLADTLQDADNFTLVMEDFLQVDLAAWVDRYRSQGYDVVIAANLPYYITTPILFKIFESKAEIAAITVMMQKEVADRFHARPGSKDYNALSVITQFRCSVHPVMKVPRNVFLPKPNVDSAVLQYRFIEHAPLADEERFFAMVKACFAMRRKTILNNFTDCCEDKAQAMELLTRAGIDPSTRSEQLPLDAFLHLYEVYEHESGSKRENQSLAGCRPKTE